MSSNGSAPTVLIVDDSSLIRNVVRDVLESDGWRVVGEAVDGFEAIAQVHEFQPDLVTLDIEMPKLGGIDTLGYIMSESPRPVVMLSAFDEHGGADLTIKALELGAVDFVRKPSWAEQLDEATLRERLITAARGALDGNLRALQSPGRLERAWRGDSALRPMPAAQENRGARHIIVIAASTGGPRALNDLMQDLSLAEDSAVVIVQHMPSGFTDSLARRLDQIGRAPVREARDGEVIRAGHVYVAPGGRHLRLEGGSGSATVQLNDGPPRHGVRPCADETLQSASAVFGDRTISVVLTGMGRDGATGSQSVREVGGLVMVQTPRSCVVAGMPSAVLASVAVDLVADPGEIGRSLRRFARVGGVT